MNLYHCWRELSDRNLSAVVQANSGDRASEILGWEIDEDTLSITVNKKGEAESDTECIWCEESL